MKNGLKRLRSITLLTLLTFGVFMLLQTVAFAGSVSNNSTKPIRYKVTKDKQIRYILPGEENVVKSVIPRDAVVTSSNDKVIQVANNGRMKARKPGKAKITMTSDEEKTKYIVTVEVISQVDLIIFAGQSNMCGSGGNKMQAPTPKAGTAYEFDVATNSKKCLSMREPFGQGTNRRRGLDDHRQYSVSGTLVSAFSIAYFKQTKMPVVGVPAAWGGSSTNTWLNRGLVSETQKRVKQAKQYLKKKNIKIRHIYMVWYQGESDAQQGYAPETHMKNMKKIYKRMKTVGVEQIMIIQIGRDANRPDVGYPIMQAQTNLCKQDKHFTFVSGKAKTFLDNFWGYYSDSIHINQRGLNIIGTEAGTNAGKYAKKHSKKK